MKIGCSIILGIVLAGLVALGIAFLSVWDYATLHYRLTYVVETPDGERTASSVIYVRREDTTRLPLPNTGYGYVLEGEAVVIDLGQGKYLFSLIQENAYRLPPAVFDDIRPQGMGIVPFTEWLAERKPAAVVPRELYPLLVTFEDINDPASVKRVDPDDLAAMFGPGHRLKTVTLEITDDPITEGRVESVLGWWSSYENLQLDGERYRRAQSELLASQLNRLDFRRN
jgi:hypothetical protein